MKNLTIKEILIKLNSSQYYKLQFISYCMDKNANFDECDTNILIKLIEKCYEQLKQDQKIDLLENI